MSYTFDQAKKQNKKFQKMHKKVTQMIAKDLDFTDKEEVRVFQYLQDASANFDAILAWMDEQDKSKS